MGAIKRHFSNQFKWRMCTFEYDNSPTDFHVSCWQRDKTSLPLLCIRTLLFFGCLATLITSWVFQASSDWTAGYWFIYMTHWGLILITVNSGIAFVVSCRAYLKGPCSADFGLPWYLKLFWAIDNIATTIAVFITIFYWTILASGDIDYGVDPVLDIFIHAMNSVFMVGLLLTSRHPIRIMHFYWPVIFGLVYVFFTVIYYAAGGTDPFGNPWVYPVLDWSQPGQSTILVVICAVVIIITHAVVVSLSQFRDFASKRLRNEGRSLSIPVIQAYN